MEYKIKLDMSMDANSLNTLLGALGSGPHNFVRPIIDNILAQARNRKKLTVQNNPLLTQKSWKSVAQTNPMGLPTGTAAVLL